MTREPTRARPASLPMSLTAAVLLPLAVAAAQAPPTPAPAGARDLLVRCKSLVVAPDTIVAPGELLVRDGKVAHIGREIPAEARVRARAVAFADATIVPGFVLAHTTLGRDGDLVERTAPLTPDLLAKDAFDPFQRELLDLPRDAVTSCALAPASLNVAGGFAALVKPGAELGRISRDQVFAKFALVASARTPERPPTALMGAIDLLREALRAAGRGGSTEAAAFTGVLHGDRRAFVHAESRAELLATLALAHEFGIEPVLVGASQADDLIEPIAQARAAVALWPLQPSFRDSQLQLPARLEARGVPFCFIGDAMALRASAALAIRYGTSRKQALAALTRVPAELCASTESVGSLRRGCDADFAVFSGDPLDLDSRLLATYVDGVQLVGTPPPTTTTAAPAVAVKEAL